MVPVTQCLRETVKRKQVFFCFLVPAQVGFTPCLAGFIAFRAMVRLKHYGGHSWQKKPVSMMVDRMQRGRQELGRELGQGLAYKATLE